LNDVVDIICYAVFELSTAPTKDVVAYTVSTVADLASVPSSYTTAIVKDLNRGGTFIWSSTGTANGGTVFAGATGFWHRQYSGAIQAKWFNFNYLGLNNITLLRNLVETYHPSSVIEFTDMSFTVDVTSVAEWDGIKIKSNSKLIGNNCTITVTGTTSVVNVNIGDLFLIKGENDITISGFKFINTSNLDATVPGAAGCNHFISIVGEAIDFDTRNIIIENNYFKRNYASAIASKTWDGENTIKIRDIHVLNNIFEESGGHCVTFAHVWNGVVSNNTSYNHQGLSYGTVRVGMFCDISHGCNGCVVDSNTEDGCIAGIKSQTHENEPSDNHVFSNNVFKNFTPDGADTANQYAIQIAGNNTTVTGNVIYLGIDRKTGVQNTEAVNGITVASFCDNFTVSNNTITVNGIGITHDGGTGIYETGTAGVISGNTIKTLGTAAGVWMRSHFESIISNNFIDASSSTGIAVWVDGGASVIGNRIIGGSSAFGAVYLNDTFNSLPVDVKIDNNNITNTLSTGATIQIPSGALVNRVDINNNTIITTSSNAILLRSAQQCKISISNNYIESTIASGATGSVRLIEGTKGAVINGNTIKVNSTNSLNYRAIQVTEGENLITSNNIFASYTAIYLATNYDLVANNIINVAVVGSEIAGVIGANTLNVNNIKKLVTL
jgi:hypothetical protein